MDESIVALPPGTALCTTAELDSLADGQCRIVRLDEKRSVLVLRSGERLQVFLNRCPHFGVEIARQPEHLYFEAHQWLRCGVHYAKFRWEDGCCVSGDCEGESLVSVPHAIADGRLVVG